MRLLSAYEPARLAALERLGVTSGGSEPTFDSLVELARRNFASDVSAINFLDSRRVWIKAIAGWRARSLPRAATFCDRVVDGDDVLEVDDALHDARFAQLALVQSGPRLRFYAGAPIKDARGYGVGTFCIYGTRPRSLGQPERECLRDFARVTGELCELHRQARAGQAKGVALHQLDRVLALFQSVLAAVSEAHDLPAALALAAERIAAITGWRARGVWRPGARLAGELLARASLERRAVLSRVPSPTAAIPVLAGDEVVGVLTFELDGHADALPQVAAVVQQVGALVRRRRVEDALRVSEQKLRSVTESARDGIITVARDGTVVYANPAARDLFGRDELRGLPLGRLIPAWSDALDSIRMGGPNMIERVAVHRAKGEFPVELSCAEWTMDNSGYVTTFVRDVTERQEARAQREAAQQRLAFLFRATSELLEQPLSTQSLLDTLTRLVLPALADWCIVDLVGLGDRVGRHERLRRVASAPGVAAGAAIDAHECFASDGSASLVARVLSGGQPILLSPDGNEVSLALPGFHACLIVPLVARGRTIGAVSLISFARGYTPDDLALSTELAHRLALALDNAQLYDETRSAVQVRDDVLAIVSHDLRNPLSTIMTSTERLLIRASDETRQSLERCQRAARRMARMISDLVDAAGLETGTLWLDRREHDIARVMQDAIDQLQPLAEARSITLDADAPVELAAFCDRERIVQVLSNIVGNAIKFAPSRSEVHLSATLVSDMVRISVADAGPGIAPELMEHIFDRYWHTRSSDNRHGAGLGLYIAKGIVEGHGGRIWVDSMPRRGSTFHFTLPALSAKAIHVAH